MKILYLANIRLPTEKGHGQQIMYTCSALADLGHEVTLVVPARESADEKDIFEHYGLQKNFSIKRIFGMRLVSWGKIGFLPGSVIFALSVYMSIKTREYDAVYTRDELLVRKGYFYEMHDVRKSIFQKNALKKAGGIVTITQGLADYCYSIGIKKDIISVAPDAVHITDFDIKESKEECRKKLALPHDKKIVLYSGHLYSWKGADTLAQSAQFLSSNVSLTFLGGHDQDIKIYREKFNFGTEHASVDMLGYVSHHLLPFYFKAADILILPNSAKEDISRLYTSPLKMFEYMSSGTPIIASDLPSIHEVLNEKNAYFFEADNASSLAQAIKNVLDKPAEATIIATRALADVQEYTWDKRAAKILAFISRINQL